MNAILSVAMVVTLVTAFIILIRFGSLKLNGASPVSTIAFTAILFTSGLDVGLIMFPLTEFPVFETEKSYGFTNALALEFGFWGFLVWAFYFLTTFYFVVVEHKLKLFEIVWVKAINNAVIIATCAFTGFLFLDYLPTYIPGIEGLAKFGLVALVVLLAVASSTDIRFVRWLSLGSTFLFLVLIVFMFVVSEMGSAELFANLAEIEGYFTNLPRFILPISELHSFYLFWWFSWSIMIGQFVARFVGGMAVWQLLIAMLVIPSILIALWFSVLFHFHTEGIEIVSTIRAAMIIVGIVFVVNSLDSLTRLYSENLNMAVDRLGKLPYLLFHWSLLYGLILLYQFTPLKIEWIGLIVIGLYFVIYLLVFQKRESLKEISLS